MKTITIYGKVPSWANRFDGVVFGDSCYGIPAADKCGLGLGSGAYGAALSRFDDMAGHFDSRDACKIDPLVSLALKVLT